MTELTKKGVIINRINYYKSVISKTMLAIQKYKLLDVISHNDYNFRY